MFRIFETKSIEERLCEKYAELMHRAYQVALVDKERSDRLNEKAKKILRELRRMHCQYIDP